MRHFKIRHSSILSMLEPQTIEVETPREKTIKRGKRKRCCKFKISCCKKESEFCEIVNDNILGLSYRQILHDYLRYDDTRKFLLRKNSRKRNKNKLIFITTQETIEQEIPHEIIQEVGKVLASITNKNQETRNTLTDEEIVFGHKNAYAGFIKESSTLLQERVEDIKEEESKPKTKKLLAIVKDDGKEITLLSPREEKDVINRLKSEQDMDELRKDVSSEESGRKTRGLAGPIQARRVAAAIRAVSSETDITSSHSSIESSQGKIVRQKTVVPRRTVIRSVLPPLLPSGLQLTTDMDFKRKLELDRIMKAHEQECEREENRRQVRAMRARAKPQFQWDYQSVLEADPVLGTAIRLNHDGRHSNDYERVTEISKKELTALMNRHRTTKKVEEGRSTTKI